MHQLNYAALPIIVADTSALMDLALAETHGDFSLPPRAEHFQAQPFGELVDAMLSGNQRTLITTRENFVECFRTQMGRLDLAPDANGHPCVEPAVSDAEFYEDKCSQPKQAILHQLFSRYQQTGKLRCYLSVDEMLAAGELDRPKGGMVIVDTDSHPRPLAPYGKRNPDYDKNLPCIDRATSAENGFKGSGDDCLVSLTSHLMDYAMQHQLPQRYLFLNNDSELSRRIADVSRAKAISGRTVYPVSARAHEMLWALQLSDTQPKITSATAKTFTDAMQFERSTRGYELVSNSRGFFEKVKQATEWLAETGPSRAAGHEPKARWTTRSTRPQPDTEPARAAR